MNRNNVSAHATFRVALAAAVLALTACGGGSDAIQPVAAGCFDSRLYAANTRVELQYSKPSAPHNTMTESREVLSTNATFNSTTGLVATKLSSIDTYRPPGGNILVAGEKVVYQSFPRPGVVALHGSVATTRGNPGERTLSYSPPSEDVRATLAPGEEATNLAQGTDSRPGVDAPPQPFSTQTRIKFVGVETVTLSTGVYQACRYESLDAPGGYSEWIYRGIKIRSGFLGVPASIVEMTSGTINGVPI